MRHKKTKQMLDYWMDLFTHANSATQGLQDPVWPDRSSIQPSACRSLLGDMFILERSEDGMRYRLAGTRLCALYGRELRGEAFDRVFVPADHRSVADWTSRLDEEGIVALICSSAENADGRRVVLETLLLPLTCGNARNNRIIGSTIVCKPPIWAGEIPLVRQRIRSERALAPWKARNLQPQTSKTQAFSAPPIQYDPESPARETVASLVPGGRSVQHLKVIEGGRQ